MSKSKSKYYQPAAKDRHVPVSEEERQFNIGKSRALSAMFKIEALTKSMDPPPKDDSDRFEYVMSLTRSMLADLSCVNGAETDVELPAPECVTDGIIKKYSPDVIMMKYETVKKHHMNLAKDSTTC
jgi:hypothetical protein